MSQLSQALETEVAALDAVRRQDRALGPRERVQVDRHVARLLRLLAPRIRYLTRSYGLTDAEDDARQACAIGLIRAVEMYDPAKASFTTLVTWQLRGELQGLRHRLRLDQRGSARAVGACTISLDGIAALSLEDADAQDRAEALAAQVLARRACGQLLDEHLAAGSPDRLIRDHAITLRHMVGREEDAPEPDGLDPEQRRQIARRTIRALGQIARGNPRYDPDAAPTHH